MWSKGVRHARVRVTRGRGMLVNRRHQEPPLGLEPRLCGPVRDEALVEPIREDHLGAKGIYGAHEATPAYSGGADIPITKTAADTNTAPPSYGRCEGASAHKRGKLGVDSNMASYGIDAHRCRADRQEEEWVEARRQTRQRQCPRASPPRATDDVVGELHVCRIWDIGLIGDGWCVRILCHPENLQRTA